jgi:hypothetical protein
MQNWAFLLFVAACGFAASGLLSSAHRVLSEVELGFRLDLKGPATILWSVFLCMFAGPYILVNLALPFWRAGRIPASGLAAVAAIAVVWSFCAGVLVVQLIAILGLVSF